MKMIRDKVCILFPWRRKCAFCQYAHLPLLSPSEAKIVFCPCSYLKLVMNSTKVINNSIWLYVINMQQTIIKIVPEKSNLIQVVPVHKASNSFAIFQCKLADPWQPFLLKGLLQVKQWVWAYCVWMVKTHNQWMVHLWARSNMIVDSSPDLMTEILAWWQNKKPWKVWYSGFTFQVLPNKDWHQTFYWEFLDGHMSYGMVLAGRKWRSMCWQHVSTLAL